MSQAQHTKPTGEEKQDSQEHPLLLAFGRMQNMLLDTARRILHSHEDAEDALQEAFVRLWSRSERIKDEEDASAMLYVTTRNISISSLRKRNTNKNVETGQTQENIAPSHEEELERKETFCRIEEIVKQKLTPLQQDILRMREYEEQSYEEIAKLLDMQPPAVRMQLSRARKTIRECYKQLQHE